MIYTDMGSLVLAIWQTDADDVESLKRFADIARAYYDAMHNAPDGIFGVGAIVYAEQAMINYQLGLVEV